jgi:hypothetical protein
VWIVPSGAADFALKSIKTSGRKRGHNCGSRRSVRRRLVELCTVRPRRPFGLRALEGRKNFGNQRRGGFDGDNLQSVNQFALKKESGLKGRFF